MINNNNDNITNNIKNDVTIAGTDFFADSENFLNELTDSELAQINGGAAHGSTESILECGDQPSHLSLLLCQ